MKRRTFLHTSASVTASGVLASVVRGGSLVGIALQACNPGAVRAESIGPLDAAAFRRMRRFVATRYGRIAYVERGSGPAAVFLHGYPLNGFQWRGALERLAPHRRCIAPDFLGLGYTETDAGQDLSPATQANMIIAVLDALGVKAADVVASDSGLTVAQLLAVEHPARVRSLLLTNGDVYTNSPPAGLAPFMAQLRAGVAADQWLAPQLANPAEARSARGLGGGAYGNPADFTDECVDYYFAPLLATRLRKAQFQGYGLAFEPNPLPAIASKLRQCAAPARMVWGTGDKLFDVKWAEWLDATLPHSRGIRRIEGAKLFFPEEMPDLMADEARALWGIRQ
jgi:haloalkane dehalogenase